MTGRGATLWLNRTMLAGVLVQIYAAGMAIWGKGSGLHQGLGWILLLLGIVLAIVAWRSKDPKLLRPAALIPVLLLLQPVLVFGLAPVSGWFGALHPLNGALIVVVHVVLEGRSRRSLSPAS